MTGKKPWFNFVHPKRFIYLLFLPVITFLLAASGPEVKELKIGKKMPLKNYEMPGVDGNVHTLEQLKKANGLIVIFSCNTCPFVVGSDAFAGWEGQYNALHDLAEKANIGFVLVNSNEAKRTGDDSLEAMQSRATLMGYTMPYVVDVNAELANAFGGKTTPHVFCFDGDEKLFYRGSIDNSYDSKRTETVTYLVNAISALSTSSKLKQNTTPPRGCSIKRKS